MSLIEILLIIIFWIKLSWTFNRWAFKYYVKMSFDIDGTWMLTSFYILEWFQTLGRSSLSGIWVAISLIYKIVNEAWSYSYDRNFNIVDVFISLGKSMGWSCESYRSLFWKMRFGTIEILLERYFQGS